MLVRLGKVSKMGAFTNSRGDMTDNLAMVGDEARGGILVKGGR